MGIARRCRNILFSRWTRYGLVYPLALFAAGAVGFNLQSHEEETAINVPVQTGATQAYSRQMQQAASSLSARTSQPNVAMIEDRTRPDSNSSVASSNSISNGLHSPSAFSAQPPALKTVPISNPGSASRPVVNNTPLATYPSPQLGSAMIDQRNFGMVVGNQSNMVAPWEELSSLVQRLVHAPNQAAREELQLELLKKASEEFDNRQSTQREKLAVAKSKIAAWEKSIESRDKMKRELVESYICELLSTSHPLSWDYSGQLALETDNPSLPTQEILERFWQGTAADISQPMMQLPESETPQVDAIFQPVSPSLPPDATVTNPPLNIDLPSTITTIEATPTESPAPVAEATKEPETPK